MRLLTVCIRCVSLKSCKISNVSVEILRIYEDYVLNKDNFYLNVTEWLASPCGSKCSKPVEEVLNVLKWFYMSERKKDGTSVCRKLSSSMTELHLRAAIDSSLRSLPLNKPFFIFFDSAFTEANKVLEHL